MFKRFLHELVLLALLASLWGIAPVLPVAAQPSQAGISPGMLLNPDGTLKLDGSARGALDLSGYSVQIDPKRGPLFTPLAAQNNWDAVGEGSGPLNDTVNAVAVSGTDVYIGGWFTDVAGIPEADYIAHWNGSQWLPLSNGGVGVGALSGSVNAVLYAGGYLYAAGWFGTVKDTSGVTIAYASRLARWNDSGWSAVPGITANLGDVAQALAFDSASNILYVGGNFLNVNGNTTADRVFGIDLDTPALVTLGSNGASDGSILGSVYALAVNSTGAVYVGGYFQDVNNGGVTLAKADYIVKWDGVNWSALGDNGSGGGALNSTVTAIAIDASDNVYAGGLFTNAAGLLAADYIAKYASSTWSALGDNGSGDGALSATSGGSTIQEIVINGTDVYVGGYFTGPAAIPTADYVARFASDTGDWYGLGDNGAADGAINTGVTSLAMSSGSLYVGGLFFDINNGGTTLPLADFFAVYSSGNWSTFGDPDGVFSTTVNDMTVIGTDVYVAGNFVRGGGDPRMDYLVRWDGSKFNPLGNLTQVYSSIGGYVNALAVDGTNLYAAGSFVDVYNEGVPVSGANRIAMWDGSTWHALGNGLNGIVYALAVDASHNLYAGGIFTDAGGIGAADYVAKWNGSSWSALGGIGAGNGAVTDAVRAIGVSGANLYIGGSFTSVKDTNNTDIPNSSFLAKWDGSTWYAMNGITQLNSTVTSIAVSGSDLYIGGAFSDLNGIFAADKVAKWDGGTWSALGSNGAGGGSLLGTVSAIAVDGTDVYVGGAFMNVTNTDGTPLTAADYAAKWNGGTWSALGSDGASNGSLSGSVYAFMLLEDDLWVGGVFKNVNNGGTIIKEADHLAVYGKDFIPNVVSSTCATTCTSSALSVDFTVTFSEPVLNVDSADFVLTPSGAVSGASITAVTGTDATRTVTVNTGTGNGTLRLDIPDTATINDTGGNSLGGLPYTAGQTYTITKRITVRSAGAKDGWVLESGATTNAGGTMNSGTTTLRLGDDAAKKQYRTILSFATGAPLPDNAVITNVILKVKRQGVVGGGDPVSAFQGFMVDIKKGFFGTAALQLTDWQAAAHKTIGPFSPALTSGWYAINLTTAKDYINVLSTGSGLTQIRLRFKLGNTSDSIANYLVLYSGNHATVSYRPQLIVEFHTP